MSAGLWSDVKRILQTALQLPREQRSTYLDQACGREEDLRREVEAYLSYESEAGALFGVTAWRSEPENAPELAPDPDFAGPYRILRRIAEGGMGVVYLAERDDGHYRHRWPSR